MFSRDFGGKTYVPPSFDDAIEEDEALTIDRAINSKDGDFVSISVKEGVWFSSDFSIDNAMKIYNYDRLKTYIVKENPDAFVFIYVDKSFYDSNLSTNPPIIISTSMDDPVFSYCRKTIQLFNFHKLRSLDFLDYRDRNIEPYKFFADLNHIPQNKTVDVIEKYERMMRERDAKQKFLQDELDKISKNLYK